MADDFEAATHVNKVWYDTELDGTPIQPSISIPTRSGTKKWYQEPFASNFGYSNWPARTNKVTCRKFNPVNTTGITKSGDAAAVLSVVDDTAALTAAGLIGICTSGKVYKLDNSAGSGVSYVVFSGPTTNINPHSGQIYVLGDAARIIDGNNLAVWNDFDSAVSFTARTFTNITPSVTTTTLALRVPAGANIQFILPQLEEGAFATPPIFDPINDSLTSITRAATNLSLPTAGVLPVNDFGIWVEAIPGATGQATPVLFGSHADANNYLEVYANATQVRFYKVVAGAFAGPVTTYTHTKDVPFQVQAYQSLAGMGIRIKPQGGAWTAWQETTDATSLLNAVIGSTYSVGSRNAANHFSGYYPSLAIIQHADPKAELERLTLKYGA
jgi:hypothetical protein